MTLQLDGGVQKSMAFDTVAVAFAKDRVRAVTYRGEPRLCDELVRGEDDNVTSHCMEI